LSEGRDETKGLSVCVSDTGISTAKYKVWNN